MIGIDHVEILDQTGLLVFMVSRDDIVVHNDYINFTVRLCETDEMFNESEMTVQIGDVISWEYDELEYFAEVVGINGEGDYCVTISYYGMGLTQDCISKSEVLRVFKQKGGNK